MMVQRFEHIQTKLAEAKSSGNSKQIKLWRNKLNKWQAEYGAYRPYNYSGKVTEL